MIITCSNCGAKNRVDERAAERMQARCGRCGTALDVAAPASDSGKPLTISDQTLDPFLSQAGEKPVLVDCWAAWCAPCRAIAPTIDQLAAEAAGKYLVAKLDVDSNPRTAARFRIEGIPALLILKQGQLVDHLVGLQPKQVIASRLQSHL